VNDADSLDCGVVGANRIATTALLLRTRLNDKFVDAGTLNGAANPPRLMATLRTLVSAFVIVIVRLVPPVSVPTIPKLIGREGLGEIERTPPGVNVLVGAGVGIGVGVGVAMVGVGGTGVGVDGRTVLLGVAAGDGVGVDAAEGVGDGDGLLVGAGLGVAVGIAVASTTLPFGSWPLACQVLQVTGSGRSPFSPQYQLCAVHGRLATS